jgi:Rieske Fe-S protein
LGYLLNNGVSIFKNTAAKSVEQGEDGILTIETGGQQHIRCKNLVIATAYPFFEGDGLYFTRLEASRSYLMAFPIEEPFDDHYMIISNASEPYSLRYSHTDGVHYLLVGGQGHKVGQADSEMDSYQRLIDFAKAHFAVGDAAFRWSAQDYKAVDKVPYIGKLTDDDENIFVATGFNKWGMSNGSFAGILIRDLISGTPSQYEELFSPSRGEIKSNLGSFLKTNVDVAKEFVKGKVLPDEMQLGDIHNDEGGIIKYNGKRVAAYRDPSGKLFLSDSTCTHLGCELEYNDAERSFDCPCHGSRFNYDGKVIEGAAHADLKKIEPGKPDDQ